MYKILKYFLTSIFLIIFSNIKADTIKVGVLHSLSGTMAISETTLKDTVLMLVEKQNKAGGLLGKKLEAVVVDPASDWPVFAEKAKELLTVQKGSAYFRQDRNGADKQSKKRNETGWGTRTTSLQRMLE